MDTIRFLNSRHIACCFLLDALQFFIPEVDNRFM